MPTSSELRRFLALLCGVALGGLVPLAPVRALPAPPCAESGRAMDRDRPRGRAVQGGGHTGIQHLGHAL